MALTNSLKPSAGGRRTSIRKRDPEYKREVPSTVKQIRHPDLDARVAKCLHPSDQTILQLIRKHSRSTARFGLDRLMSAGVFHVSTECSPRDRAGLARSPNTQCTASRSKHQTHGSFNPPRAKSAGLLILAGHAAWSDMGAVFKLASRFCIKCPVFASYPMGIITQQCNDVELITRHTSRRVEGMVIGSAMPQIVAVGVAPRPCNSRAGSVRAMRAGMCKGQVSRWAVPGGSARRGPASRARARPR